MSSSSGAGALQRRTRRVLNPVVTRLWDIEMSGYERLPESGPAILCPNHISFIDSAFLTFTAPRAGMYTIAAAYGYIEPGDDPGDWGADACVECSTELLSFILGQ